MTKTNKPQTTVKETLIQVFDQLSTEHKAEVLEFALLIWAREGQTPLDLRGDLEHVLSRLKPEVSLSLRGSVRHYDAPRCSINW